MGPLGWLSTIRSVINGGPLRPIMDTGVMAISYLMLRFGTIVHPFLLADNRHFTFYLWRHLLRHSTFRIGVLPLAVMVIVRGIGNSGWAVRFFHKTETKIAVAPIVSADRHLLSECSGRSIRLMLRIGTSAVSLTGTAILQHSRARSIARVCRL